VAHLGLGNKSKMYLPPSRIKLALIKKISLKAVDKESEGFAHFRQTFPKICEAKVKGRIFFCTQITQLFKDQDFNTKLNSTERRAWKEFENNCGNSTGIEKEENYNEIL